MLLNSQGGRHSSLLCARLGSLVGEDWALPPRHPYAQIPIVASSGKGLLLGFVHVLFLHHDQRCHECPKGHMTTMMYRSNERVPCSTSDGEERDKPMSEYVRVLVLCSVTVADKGLSESMLVMWACPPLGKTRNLKFSAGILHPTVALQCLRFQTADRKCKPWAIAQSILAGPSHKSQYSLSSITAASQWPCCAECHHCPSGP